MLSAVAGHAYEPEHAAHSHELLRVKRRRYALLLHQQLLQLRLLHLSLHQLPLILLLLLLLLLLRSVPTWCARTRHHPLTRRQARQFGGFRQS